MFRDQTEVMLFRAEQYQYVFWYYLYLMFQYYFYLTNLQYTVVLANIGIKAKFQVLKVMLCASFNQPASMSHKNCQDLRHFACNHHRHTHITSTEKRLIKILRRTYKKSYENLMKFQKSGPLSTVNIRKIECS